MEIYVKAVNELGEAASVPIVLEPISAGENNRIFTCRNTSHIVSIVFRE